MAALSQLLLGDETFVETVTARPANLQLPWDRQRPASVPPASRRLSTTRHISCRRKQEPARRRRSQGSNSVFTFISVHAVTTTDFPMPASLASIPLQFDNVGQDLFLGL